MAVAIPYVVAAMTVMQAYGQSQATKQQGKVDRATAYANAKVERQRADEALAAKSREAQLHERDTRYRASAALARGAAAGLGNSRVLINALTEIGSMGRFNAEGAIYEGKSAHQTGMHSAAVMEWQGDEAYKQAKYKAKGQLFGGIAKGMAQLYGAGAFGGAGGAAGATGPAKFAPGLTSGTRAGGGTILAPSGDIRGFSGGMIGGGV